MQDLDDNGLNSLAIYINSYSKEDLSKIFSQYTYKGQKLSSALFPNLTDATKQKIEELLRESVETQWNALTKTDLAAVSQFLRDYATTPALRAYFDDKYYDLIKGSTEAQAINGYLRLFPDGKHKGDFDDTYYNLIKGSTSEETLKGYLSLFPNGNHKDEVENKLSIIPQLKAERAKWNAVDKSKISAIMAYIDQNPNSPFIEEARESLKALKDAELQRLSDNGIDYNRDELLALISSGIFTKEDLVENGILTDCDFDLLEKYKQNRQYLPNIESVIGKCSIACPKDATDIYFFGIPGTGKSCILAGLLADTNNLYFNAVSAGASYAQVLNQYTNVGCPPPPTKMNYLTTIQASVKDESDVLHNINLVEMAGEEFAFKIANNDADKTTFADMGEGAPELLSNGNRKVFFIIIDPSRDQVYQTRYVQCVEPDGTVYFDTQEFSVDQYDCIHRLVDIFGLDSNKKVMRNVEAIHFIVTKADTLSADHEQRVQKATDIVKGRYQMLVDMLAQTCQDIGINQSDNGRPRLYTFSLGTFHPGNLFEYDNTDAAQIANAISSYTMGNQNVSFMGRFRNLF